MILNENLNKGWDGGSFNTPLQRAHHNELAAQRPAHASGHHACRVQERGCDKRQATSEIRYLGTPLAPCLRQGERVFAFLCKFAILLFSCSPLSPLPLSMAEKQGFAAVRKCEWERCDGKSGEGDSKRSEPPRTHIFTSSLRSDDTTMCRRPCLSANPQCHLSLRYPVQETFLRFTPPSFLPQAVSGTWRMHLFSFKSQPRSGMDTRMVSYIR